MTDQSAPPAVARAELWLLAADSTSLWLLEPEPRLSSPASAEDGLDGSIAQLLAADELHDSVRLVRSTSWRPGDGGILYSYVAALHVHGEIPEAWLQAQRICDLALAAGPAVAGPAVGPAASRPTDVVMHAVRTLAVLYDDPGAAVAADLTRDPEVPEFHPAGSDVARVLREIAWGEPLSSLRSVFAAMYRNNEQ